MHKYSGISFEASKTARREPVALSGDALASSVLLGVVGCVLVSEWMSLADGLCSHEKWAGTPMGAFFKDSLAAHLMATKP